MNVPQMKHTCIESKANYSEFLRAVSCLFVYLVVLMSKSETTKITNPHEKTRSRQSKIDPYPTAEHGE